MSIDSDWKPNHVDHGSRVVDAGMGLLRITLLFGSAAVALALIATPYLAESSRHQVARSGYGAGIDMMNTGSIGASSYTIRKSVLQPSPRSVCVIRSSGVRSGEC